MITLGLTIQGYNRGTPDLYPFPKSSNENSSSLLAVRPRFVGLNRPTPRRHFAYSIAIHHCAFGKAGGHCAPHRGDCGARAGGAGSAGCAGRPSHSRRAGTRLLALGLRQSGGENTGRKPHAMTERRITVLAPPHQAVLASPDLSTDSRKCRASRASS